MEYVGLDSEDMLNQSEMMKKESLKLDNMKEWYSYIVDKEYRQRVDKNKGLYLSTFHGAKGLEWKKVIIISANERITPYAYMGKVDDYEEERRLFYVAMTRAKDELDILYIEGSGNAPDSLWRKVFLKIVPSVLFHRTVNLQNTVSESGNHPVKPECQSASTLNCLRTVRLFQYQKI